MEKKESLLKAIEGQQLSAVAFVMDYLQLQFNSDFLTSYVWPELKTTDAVIDNNNPEYKNALCNLITKIVAQAEEGKDKLTIKFEDNSVIEIPMTEENKRKFPEIATLICSDKRWQYWPY